MRHIRTILKWSAGLLFIAFVLIQLAPVDRANPAVEAEVPATAEARLVLREAVTTATPMKPFGLGTVVSLRFRG